MPPSLKGHPPEQALLDFAAGTLPPEMAERISAHVKGCTACTNYISMLNESTAPGQGLDPAEIEKVRREADTAKTPARRSSQPPQKPRPSQPGTAKRQSLPPRKSQPPRAESEEEDVGFARTNIGRTPSGEIDPSRTSDELLGTVVGEYKLLERLGQGGMGTVYKAEHKLIGKAAAVKVLLQMFAGDASLAQRMLAEARAVNAVRHPNIVDVFSFGQLPDGRPYLVMELLSGSSLADLLVQNHSLSIDRALHVLSEALAALEAAHAVGVVHRDLKPDNIFINTEAKPWKVKLLDFGLAKTAQVLEAKLTRPGAVMGTPGYMAPEQVRSADSATEKTDVYAMGVVAWATLAGHEPFRGDSAVEIMHQHLTVPAPPLGKAADDIPPALDALVSRMLAKDPDQRPTAAEARAEIDAIRNGGVAAASAPPPPAPKSAPSTAMVAGIGLTVVAVVVGALLYSVLSKPEVPVVPLESKLQPMPLPQAPKHHKKDVPVAEPEPQKTVAAVETAHDAGVQLRTWPCADIAQIGDVDQSADQNQPYFVELKFNSRGNVLLAARKTKRDRALLAKFAGQIVVCKSEKATLAATKWDDENHGYSTLTLAKATGTLVWLDDAQIQGTEGVLDATAIAEKPSAQQQAMRWPCDTLASVSDATWTLGRGYRLVLLRFRNQPNMMLVADADPKAIRVLEKLRKAILRCEGTQKVLVASKYNDNHPGFMAENFTNPKGIKVNVMELMIEDR